MPRLIRLNHSLAVQIMLGTWLVTESCGASLLELRRRFTWMPIMASAVRAGCRRPCACFRDQGFDSLLIFDAP